MFFKVISKSVDPHSLNPWNIVKAENIGLAFEFSKREFNEVISVEPMPYQAYFEA